MKKYGKWAVISGSTDGIGLAMARQLAQRGHSIVVIGRNEEKLTNVKESLENEANVGEIVTIKIDLSDSSVENFESIREKLDPDNRDIGILINCAGTFPNELKRFHNFDMTYLRDIVNLNILATVYLTKMILPGMIDRQKGLVVNVSSMLSLSPGAFFSLYSPTKTFTDAFSRQLQVEYYKHPIDIVNLTPGGVVTKLYALGGDAKPNFYTPTAEGYARSAINAVSTRISSFCGTFGHAIFRHLSAPLNVSWIAGPLGDLPFKTAGMKSSVSPVMARKQRS